MEFGYTISYLLDIIKSKDLNLEILNQVEYCCNLFYFSLIFIFLTFICLLVNCNNLFQFLLLIELLLVNISFTLLILTNIYLNIESLLLVIIIVCIATVETVVGLSLFIKLKLFEEIKINKVYKEL